MKVLAIGKDMNSLTDTERQQDKKQKSNNTETGFFYSFRQIEDSQFQDNNADKQKHQIPDCPFR
jgi:hypothetical protein